jgi:hypothetical protein
MIQEENNPLDIFSDNITETEKLRNITILIQAISENEELGMGAVKRIHQIISKYNAVANDNNLSEDKKPEVLQEAQKLEDELLAETNNHELILDFFIDLRCNYLRCNYLL